MVVESEPNSIPSSMVHLVGCEMKDCSTDVIHDRAIFFKYFRFSSHLSGY